MSKKYNSKFDPEAYLAALEETGQHEAAAAKSGVTYSCAYKHRRANPDFEAACEDAQKAYSSWVYELMRGRMAGTLGKEPSDRLIELEAKRINPKYRDRHEIEHKGGGGAVLVVPAATPLADFEKTIAERNKARKNPLEEDGDA